MSKIFIVKRRLRIGDSEVVIPVHVSSKKESAVEFAGKNHQAMTELLRYAVVSPIGENMGAFGKLLDALGVSGFKPEIEEVVVEDALIQVAREIPRLA